MFIKLFINIFILINSFANKANKTPLYNADRAVILLINIKCRNIFDKTFRITTQPWHTHNISLEIASVRRNGKWFCSLS